MNSIFFSDFDNSGSGAGHCLDGWEGGYGGGGGSGYGIGGGYGYGCGLDDYIDEFNSKKHNSSYGYKYDYGGGGGGG